MVPYKSVPMFSVGLHCSDLTEVHYTLVWADNKAKGLKVLKCMTEKRLNKIKDSFIKQL